MFISRGTLRSPARVRVNGAITTRLRVMYGPRIKQKPPLRGGYVNLKLSLQSLELMNLKRAQRLERASSRICTEHGSAAKAAYSLEGFLPAMKHGSGFGDCGDGGGVVLKRRKGRPGGCRVKISAWK